MFLMRFTERAYTNYTEEDVRNTSKTAYLTIPNSLSDPLVVFQAIQRVPGPVGIL